MSKFHFFTGENSISNAQLAENGFGKLADIGSTERYNLENKFTVTANAPAFAMSKSLVLALEDALNPSLLNIALLPLDGNSMAGFPIKFIIYRGISKSQMISSGDIILEADGSWDNSNILKIIHDLQDKINTDNGTSDDPTSDSLGLQFNALPNDTFLESLFFDETDDFHPLIVPRGCQIGKFAGGTTLAGIELILDRVGSEATLSLLSAPDNIFEIEKLVIGGGLPEKEKLKLRFNNRLAKEEVLAYLDITAFYGSCLNQGFEIVGITSGSTAFLDNFINRDAVYIDIRDERGSSYNHFLRVSDNVNIGFYPSSGDPIFTSTDYYLDWPILKLDGQSYNTSDEYFFLKIPVSIGMPESAVILTAFNEKVSVGSGKDDVRFTLLNSQDRDGNIRLKESESIRLKNWSYSDNSLGSNHFLLKLDRITEVDRSQILSPIWNSYFSIKMKPIFDTTGIEEGEFRIKTYSPINAPLITSSSSDQVYYPTIGIAADKYHITFFSFYRDTAYNAFDGGLNFPLKMLDTGRFNYSFDSSELVYETSEQAVGFLYLLTQNDRVKDFQLSQYNFSDPENMLTDVKFVKYLKKGIANNADTFFRHFEAITLTHAEYDVLVNVENTPPTNDDYISDHPLYIRSKNVQSYNYEKFNLIENAITMGIVKIDGNDTTEEYRFDLTEYPEDIELDGEEIALTSVILN